MVRAVMEGVCFALRDSLELMRPFAEEVGQIRAIGGGARSRLWRQMQADVFGASVAGMGDGGGPAYGAAALAAVGGGMFDSVAETIGLGLHEDRLGPGPGACTGVRRALRGVARALSQPQDALRFRRGPGRALGLTATEGNSGRCGVLRLQVGQDAPQPILYDLFELGEILQHPLSRLG